MNELSTEHVELSVPELGKAHLIEYLHARVDRHDILIAAGAERQQKIEETISELRASLANQPNREEMNVMGNSIINKIDSSQQIQRVSNMFTLAIIIVFALIAAGAFIAHAI